MAEARRPSLPVADFLATARSQHLLSEIRIKITPQTGKPVPGDWPISGSNSIGQPGSSGDSTKDFRSQITRETGEKGSITDAHVVVNKHTFSLSGLLPLLNVRSNAKGYRESRYHSLSFLSIQQRVLFLRTRQFCIFAFVLCLALSFAKGQNALSSFFNTSTNQQEVFYIGADQNVYEIWWTLARALDRV
jgi:hypothetical protein